MSTHDKLNALRNDAVTALETAIVTVADDYYNGQPGTAEHKRLTVLGAVNAISRYTLAAQLCVQCGHRIVEHQENPETTMPAPRLLDATSGESDWVDIPCKCCVRVGRAMAENEDRA